jgi:hypothetical protein
MALSHLIIALVVYEFDGSFATYPVVAWICVASVIYLRLDHHDLHHSTDSCTSSLRRTGPALAPLDGSCLEKSFPCRRVRGACRWRPRQIGSTTVSGRSSARGRR